MMHRIVALRLEQDAKDQLSVLPQGPVANDSMVAVSAKASAVAQMGILHALLEVASAIRELGGEA